MNDRELLELAAKAAGHGDVWSLDEHPDVTYIGPRYDGGTVRYRVWNPLADDGDALRLAVRLGLDVFSRPARWAECGRIGTAGCRENYSGSTDPQAATRRAITRAAAEIERSMK